MSKKEKEVKPKPKRALKPYEIDVDVIDLCLYAEKYFDSTCLSFDDFLYLEVSQDLDIGDLVFDSEDESVPSINFTIDPTDNKWNWGYPKDEEDDL